MTNANARLRITFDFDLAVPPALANGDDEALVTALRGILGNTVFGGMPTVTGKQLAKSGVGLVRHACQCEVKRIGLASVAKDVVVAAAPHLTDEELEEAGILAAQKLPPAPAQHKAHVRRIALKLVNDYRLVPCTVVAEQSVGETIEISAQLNLTNGGVLVDDAYKKLRLKSDQPPIPVRVANTGVVLHAQLGGHTLGGPLLEVSIDALVPHRDALLACWRAGHVVSS